MTNTIHVLALSGSLRKGSYNAALLRAARELAPTGLEIEIFDISPIPFYNEEIEVEGPPEPVQRLKNRVAEADAVLIATPEYNGSVPGVLKNALDWTSRPRATSPLRDKPVAIMGTGGMGGTQRAQRHLRDIVTAVGMRLLEQPEVKIPRPWEAFDDDLKLIDAPSRHAVHSQLDALAAWLQRTRSGDSTQYDDLRPVTLAG